jgi:hypothetical protein
MQESRKLEMESNLKKDHQLKMEKKYGVNVFYL